MLDQEFILRNNISAIIVRTMLKNTKRFLIATCVAALTLTAPVANAASSQIPENPMVDPQGPPMTSTGLNRAQETTMFQNLGQVALFSTGTTSPGNCHAVQLSHQFVFCTIVSEIHFAMYPHHRNN